MSVFLAMAKLIGWIGFTTAKYTEFQELVKTGSAITKYTGKQVCQLNTKEMQMALQ